MDLARWIIQCYNKRFVDNAVILPFLMPKQMINAYRHYKLLNGFLSGLCN